MGEKSAISWTAGPDGTPGATWNPTTGCSVVSPGCELPGCELTELIPDDVMPADELAGATSAIKSKKFRRASASALNNHVRFIWLPQSLSRSPMLRAVLPPATDLKVRRVIVRFVTVDVMDHFVAVQEPFQRLRRYQPMFVNIAPTVCQGVPRSAQQDVTVGCYRAPASPVWITRTWQHNSHCVSISQPVCYAERT